MNRLGLAFAFPVGVMIVVFVIIFGLSRILLVVDDQAIATGIALGVALAILVVSFILAGRTRTPA